MSWPGPSNCQATCLRRRQDGSYLPAATVPPRIWPPAWVAVQRLQAMMNVGKSNGDLSSRCRGRKPGEGESRALCLVGVCQREVLRARLHQGSRWWHRVPSLALKHGLHLTLTSKPQPPLRRNPCTCVILTSPGELSGEVYSVLLEQGMLCRSEDRGFPRKQIHAVKGTLYGEMMTVPEANLVSW